MRWAIFVCWTTWKYQPFWFQSTYQIARPFNERCSFFMTNLFAPRIYSLSSVPFGRCCYAIAQRFNRSMAQCSGIYLFIWIFSKIKKSFTSAHTHAPFFLLFVILLKTMNQSSLADCAKFFFLHFSSLFLIIWLSTTKEVYWVTLFFHCFDCLYYPMPFYSVYLSNTILLVLIVFFLLLFSTFVTCFSIVIYFHSSWFV